jgi:hypothetical protein
MKIAMLAFYVGLIMTISSQTYAMEVNDTINKNQSALTKLDSLSPFNEMFLNIIQNFSSLAENDLRKIYTQKEPISTEQKDIIHKISNLANLYRHILNINNINPDKSGDNFVLYRADNNHSFVFITNEKGDITPGIMDDGLKVLVKSFPSDSEYYQITLISENGNSLIVKPGVLVELEDGCAMARFYNGDNLKPEFCLYGNKLNLSNSINPENLPSCCIQIVYNKYYFFDVVNEQALDSERALGACKQALAEVRMLLSENMAD